MTGGAARGGIARRTWKVSSTFARRLADVREPVPRRIRRAFIDLGPTFVKVGQVIASSPGLFPAEWMGEFASLRDQVPPFPGAEAREIVENDLGRPLSSAFATFGDEPLAAASIAQVHAATLLDGTEVVVKVQRPGLDDQVRDELRALLLVCEVLEHIPQASVGSPRALAEDFARTLGEEMDFRLEADNMRRMQRILVASDIDDCRVPRVYDDLVGRRVLTMERIRGLRFTDVEGMRARGIDTERVLRLGVQTVVEGVLVHGFFHGDLHAGNIAVLDDGTFVLFDFGIVGRLTESARGRLATYLMAVTTNDYPAMVRALRSFGSVPADVDVQELAATIQRLYEPFVREGVMTAQLGVLLDTMIRSMVQYRVRIPRELVLLSKQMLYLEGSAQTLAPHIDLLQEQQIIYGSLMAKYPELAAQIQAAMQRGKDMDAAIASGAVPA
jgi:predicted unusual protein kinase regulating ubiquinone biosynthesis (AarF/ABC1/UbiB family)